MGDLVELCFQIFALTMYMSPLDQRHIYMCVSNCNCNQCLYLLLPLVTPVVLLLLQTLHTQYFISKLFSFHWLYEINIVVISSDRGYIVIGAVIVVIVW